MPLAQLSLGPWSGGLNLTSNRDLSVFLKPNELGEALNVTYTQEGFIQPRPGCRMVLQTTGMLGAPDELYTGSPKFNILGEVRLPDGRSCVLVQSVVGTQATVWKVFSPTNIVLYFKPANNHYFTHVIMHDGGLNGHRGVIFFGRSDNTSYLTTTFDLTGTPTIISSTGAAGTACKIPGSDGGIIVKNRLFLWQYNTSRFMWSPAQYILDFSKIEDENFSGSDIYRAEIIDHTTAADGITSVEFLNNNFYIFKKTKTYLFTYQADPYNDAYLRKISDQMGAHDSTIYRNNIIIVNGKGIFRLDTTEFLDLQRTLNLRFEIPIDHNDIEWDDIFITDFNNDILMGFRDVTRSNQTHYYSMNGYNGAWARWDFDYNRDTEPDITIASPGSRQYRCQDANTTESHMIFTTFDRSRLVYVDWKPESLSPAQVGVNLYHFDSNLNMVQEYEKVYIPSVNIKTLANIGGAMTIYKKVHRVFGRMYLSEHPATLIDYPEGLWTLSFNFNDYRYGNDLTHDTEQLLYLYPTSPDVDIDPNIRSLRIIEPFMENITEDSVVYKRTYQLPIRQFRAVEFVAEVNRKWSAIDYFLKNTDADRSIKQGYYFLMSALWCVYEDRAEI